MDGCMDRWMIDRLGEHDPVHLEREERYMK